MKQAMDFDTWLEAASLLDEIDDHESWKRDDRSEDYDYVLIKKNLNAIRQARKSGDVLDLVYVLRQCLLRNLGNISNPNLFNRSNTGTKYLLDNYVKEVISSLNYITDNKFRNFPQEEKLVFISETLQSFGRCALLLSGGVTLGYFHI